MQLATTGQRVIGYFIDAVILGVAGTVIFVVLDAIELDDWLGGTVAFLVYYGYFSYMEGTTGQTIGKRAMGTRVVTADSGLQITMGQSLLRNILRIVDALFVGLVGLVLVMVTPKKQRLGDMAAATVVVKR